MVCVTQKSSCAREARCGVLHAAVRACAGMLSAGSCVRDSEKDYSACEGVVRRILRCVTLRRISLCVKKCVRIEERGDKQVAARGTGREIRLCVCERDDKEGCVRERRCKKRDLANGRISVCACARTCVRVSRWDVVRRIWEVCDTLGGLPQWVCMAVATTPWGCSWLCTCVTWCGGT